MRLFLNVNGCGKSHQAEAGVALQVGCPALFPCAMSSSLAFLVPRNSAEGLGRRGPFLCQGPAFYVYKLPVRPAWWLGHGFWRQIDEAWHPATSPLPVFIPGALRSL